MLKLEPEPSSRAFLICRASVGCRDASEEGLLSDNRDELPALLAELVPTGGISRSLAASLLDPNFVPGTIGLNRFRILRADHLDADASALAPCLRKRRVE